MIIAHDGASGVSGANAKTATRVELESVKTKSKANLRELAKNAKATMKKLAPAKYAHLN